MPGRPVLRGRFRVYTTGPAASWHSRPATPARRDSGEATVLAPIVSGRQQLCLFVADQACASAASASPKPTARAALVEVGKVKAAKSCHVKFWGKFWIPPGCSRYCVRLQRPLGLVLEEDGRGGIVVAEVLPNGAADRAGCVSVGDTLISTSGWQYTRSSEYGGTTVKSGEKKVTLNARGEKFDTVMAAIGTHKGGNLVELTLQQCQPTPA